MKRKNNIDQNQGIVNKKIKIQANRQSDFDMGAFAGCNAAKKQGGLDLSQYYVPDKGKHPLKWTVIQKKIGGNSSIP